MYVFIYYIPGSLKNKLIFQWVHFIFLELCLHLIIALLSNYF